MWPNMSLTNVNSVMVQSVEFDKAHRSVLCLVCEEQSVAWH